MLDFARIFGFDWDDGNHRKNERHGVLAIEAEQVFFNQPILVLEDSKHCGQEPRWHALGVTNCKRRLHLTFTIRCNATKIRIISARDMHRKERKVYEQAF